ncbi:MAG TPA: carboxypeptidase-like regulatory domain-containing protein [Candidatus Thermoplasmatota archaeon]|nr:carboxypeptidase-like regulatory domain-containing protein [Candidatus Thermoplasmatota archaeon]
MRGWIVAATVLSLLLPGCASSGSAQAGADQFKGIDVPVTQTTGGIKGVVVDAAIVPIAGAKVSLALPAGGNKTATTDKEGRFVFAGLAAGTYFLTASAPLHHAAQASAEVQAGVDPAITKIQLQPLFSQKPFHNAIKQKGFFECSQNGAGVYSSSNCVTDQCPLVMDPSTCNGLPTKAMDNVTSQSREWHTDVGAGWQAMVFEMVWQPTAQGSSPRMGMVVSTDKATRDPAHSFANVASPSPMRFELDVGKQHETGADVEPTTVPAEGMGRMSYFVSVRRDAGSPAPGLALNQDFEVFVTQFYYGTPPDGWSFVKGDPYPF